MEQDGTFDVLPKKEVIILKKEMEKLERNLGGIKMVKPEQFQLIDNEVVIVLAVKASNMAEEVFGEKKIHPKDYVCVGDLFFEDKK